MAKHTLPASRAQKGETLAEVLVALLIVALAALLLASMTATSGTIDIAARQKDTAFYAALTRVEAMDSTAKESGHQAVIEQIEPVTGEPMSGTAKNYQVDVYTADGLTLYKGVG